VSARRAFLFVLLVLGLFFFVLLRPVLIPLILAAILTFLFYPVYSFFLRKVKKTYFASFLSTFFVFLVLVFPFGFVVTMIFDQAYTFFSTVDFGTTFANLISHSFYAEHILPLVTSLEQKTGIVLDVRGMVTNLAHSAPGYLTSFSPKVLAGTAGFFFTFFVMHVSLFFLFVDSKNVLKVFFDLSPLEPHHEGLITKEITNMINATVYGYLVTALVQGALAAFGFSLAGVQAPLVFGTLTFLMSMVPLVGATSVWLPITIWYFIQGNTGWGIFLLIYGAFVVSGIDNIIKPIIMQGKAKVHILLIFFSLLGGISFFGPIGFLLGPVIMAMFLACIRIYREEFLPGSKGSL